MLRETANQATILDAIVIHTTHNRKTFTVLKYMPAVSTCVEVVSRSD